VDFFHLLFSDKIFLIRRKTIVEVFSGIRQYVSAYCALWSDDFGGGLMSANLSQMLTESASSTSVYNTSYVSTLRNKWSKMCEGIQGEHQKNVMAVLCENQSQHLQTLTEDTRATNVGSFMKYVLSGSTYKIFSN